MNLLSNKFPTKELQMRDAAHHMHPFTAQAELGEKGARVITRANGVFVYDSEGEEILDAMAGLWCVNIGYGRHELAEVAARQMKELSYYNTFFWKGVWKKYCAITIHFFAITIHFSQSYFNTFLKAIKF